MRTATSAPWDSVLRAGWELESTAANLSRMRRARSERGEDVALIERLEHELLRAAKEMEQGKGAP